MVLRETTPTDIRFYYMVNLIQIRQYFNDINIEIGESIHRSRD